MAAALEAYRAAGVTTANLGVDAANPSGAVGVYERMGFRTMQTAITFSRSIGD
jgi:ribosomal protein S18 acetylase RimI-like enzyme